MAREGRRIVAHRVTAPVPRAPARVHLILAASMWTVAGIGLAVFGVWTMVLRHQAWWLAAIAVAVGAAKGRWVLRRAAVRIADRIESRGDGKCVGGFLSPASWALVVMMALSGRLLRAWPPVAGVIGPLYLAVGTALLSASITLWRRRITTVRAAIGR